MCKGTCACGRKGEGSCGRASEAALARREARMAKKALEKHNEIEERLPRYGGGIGIKVDTIMVDSKLFDVLKKSI